MRTRSLIPAAVLLFGCSSRHRPVAPAPARGPARDSLYLLDQTRGDSVAARGAADGILALLSDDAAMLREAAPTVYGRPAAQALLSSTSAPATQSVSWQPLGGGVSADLRAAYTYGVAARATGARAAIRLERYVAYWERTAGGPWRIAAYAEVGGPLAGELPLGREALTAPVRPVSRALAAPLADVRAADSLFSDLADRMGRADAFADAIAPDGVILQAPQLIIGPMAAHDYYAAVGNGIALTWHPVTQAIASSADLGYTIGEYSVTSRGPSGAAVQHFGKYLTIWKRQPGGKWKFVAHAENGMPARANTP
jgi:ketosteroid isomerase-like protein